MPDRLQLYNSKFIFKSRFSEIKFQLVNKGQWDSSSHSLWFFALDSELYQKSKYTFLPVLTLMNHNS